MWARYRVYRSVFGFIAYISLPGDAAPLTGGFFIAIISTFFAEKARIVYLFVIQSSRRPRHRKEVISE